MIEIEGGILLAVIVLALLPFIIVIGGYLLAATFGLALIWRMLGLSCSWPTTPRARQS
jgi:hypothetical protein